MQTLWTKDLPTEPGFYWLCNKVYKEPVVVGVMKSSYCGSLYLIFTGTDEDERLEDVKDKYWSMGPLEIPVPAMDVR